MSFVDSFVTYYVARQSFVIAIYKDTKNWRRDVMMMKGVGREREMGSIEVSSGAILFIHLSYIQAFRRVI